MDNHTAALLEYPIILQQLSGYALSKEAQALLLALSPITDEAIIAARTRELNGARALLNLNGTPPLSPLTGIRVILDKIDKGGLLLPSDLWHVAQLLNAVSRCISAMRIHSHAIVDTTSPEAQVIGYTNSLMPLTELQDAIRGAVLPEGESGGLIADGLYDSASKELLRLRKRRTAIAEQSRNTLDAMLRSPHYAGCFMESLVALRQGRPTLPVKKEARKRIDGTVLDASTSGATLYIEPAAVGKFQEELRIVEAAQDREVTRILQELTQLCALQRTALGVDYEGMLHLDQLFAKARLSYDMDGKPAEAGCMGEIRLKNARHPLLGKDAVPLELQLYDAAGGLIITGPNTGGKTVVLKTVGLLAMMRQTGLHVPAEAVLGTFEPIWADIGDGQDIVQSLSTFSAHVRRLGQIVDAARPGTLVLLDELGAGTDPAEGAGLSVAVLEELQKRGAVVLATTHMGQLKTFAEETAGWRNASMAFDSVSLRPLYRLVMGESGQSNAFLIALRLGIPAAILDRAHFLTYHETVRHADMILEEDIADNTTEIAVEQPIETAPAKPMNRQTAQTVDFTIGDSVFISTLQRTGIVAQLPNARGEVAVMVQGRRLMVNRKRLKLHISGEELYTENYDLDIVLEDKENRKNKHTLERKHVPGLEVKVHE